MSRCLHTDCLSVASCSSFPAPRVRPYVSAVTLGGITVLQIRQLRQQAIGRRLSSFRSTPSGPSVARRCSGLRNRTPAMPLDWAVRCRRERRASPGGRRTGAAGVAEGRHHGFVIEVDQVGCLLGVADPFEQRRVRRELDDVGLRCRPIMYAAQCAAESVGLRRPTRRGTRPGSLRPGTSEGNSRLLSIGV